MKNDDLRALAMHCAEHVVRDRGGDAKVYATFIYAQLRDVRDKTVDAAVEMAEDVYDMTELQRLPNQIRSLKEE